MSGFTARTLLHDQGHSLAGDTHYRVARADGAGHQPAEHLLKCTGVGDSALTATPPGKCAQLADPRHAGSLEAPRVSITATQVPAASDGIRRRIVGIEGATVLNAPLFDAEIRHST